MAHTIVNPNRAADYFDTAGSAISTQPDILGGSVGGVSSNTGYFSNDLGMIGGGIGIPADIKRVVATSGTDGAITTVTTAHALGYQAVGNEILIFGSSTGVGGNVNNVLRSPASFSTDREAIHSVKSVRTTRVSKAIRNGNFSFVSGIFTTAPETSSDLSTMGVDAIGQVDAITNNSYYVFQDGSNIATTGNYPVKV